MDLNINILADQLKEYAGYIGKEVSRNSNGIVIYEIDNYILGGCRIALHYKIAFEGDQFLKHVEVTKV